ISETLAFDINNIKTDRTLSMNLRLIYVRNALAQLAVGVGLIILSPPLAQSQTSANDQSLGQDFIQTNTVLLARVETGRVALPANVAEVKSTASAQWKRIETQLQWIKKIADNEGIFAAIDIPFTPALPYTRFFVKDRGPNTLADLKGEFDLKQFPSVEKKSGYLGFSIQGSRPDANTLSIRIKQGERPEFSIAMKQVAAFPIQVAVVPPGYVKRTMQELLPELPKQFGGGPSSILTEGIQWAAIGFDPSKMTIKLIIQSESDSAAKALATTIPRSMEALLQLMPRTQSDAAKVLIENIQWTSPVIDGGRTTYTSDAKSGEQLNVLASAMALFMGRISQQNTMDRIKHISLGIHNYFSANQLLPPGKSPRDANGKSLLSWRVHILPYVDEQELYNQFKLNEPWDSPHNKPLLQKVPKIFRSSDVNVSEISGIPSGFTTIVAPVGNDTIFGQDKPVNFGHITDGSSNTAWLVEVKPELAVPWTAPQDYVFDPANPANGLQVGEEGRFIAGLADGSVMSLPVSMDAKNLHHLFQKSDGNVVQFP
ncbi:MAG: DUF1559 domain-containing protein, partial [Pirellula sp.]